MKRFFFTYFYSVIGCDFEAAKRILKKYKFNIVKIKKVFLYDQHAVEYHYKDAIGESVVIEIKKSDLLDLDIAELRNEISQVIKQKIAICRYVELDN